MLPIQVFEDVFHDALTISLSGYVTCYQNTQLLFMIHSLVSYVGFSDFYFFFHKFWEIPKEKKQVLILWTLTPNTQCISGPYTRIRELVTIVRPLTSPPLLGPSSLDSDGLYHLLTCTCDRLQQTPAHLSRKTFQIHRKTDINEWKDDVRDWPKLQFQGNYWNYAVNGDEFLAKNVNKCDVHRGWSSVHIMFTTQTTVNFSYS